MEYLTIVQSIEVLNFLQIHLGSFLQIPQRIEWSTGIQRRAQIRILFGFCNQFSNRGGVIQRITPNTRFLHRVELDVDKVLNLINRHKRDLFLMLYKPH